MAYSPVGTVRASENVTTGPILTGAGNCFRGVFRRVGEIDLWHHVVFMMMSARQRTLSEQKHHVQITLEPDTDKG